MSERRNDLTRDADRKQISLSVNDERGDRNGTEQRPPVVAFAAKLGRNRRSGRTLRSRRRKHRGERWVREPRRVHRARVRAVHARVGGQQRWLIDVLEDRAVAGRETRQGIPQQVLLPVSNWPDRIHEIMPAKFAQLEDPQLVRLYRVLSEIFDGDAGDDTRLEEAAEIMAGLFEQAYASGDLGEMAHDDLAFDLLDAFAVESDPRAERLQDLMRERGWAGWIRSERLAEPPD